MRALSAIPDRRLSWFPVVSCPRLAPSACAERWSLTRLRRAHAQPDENHARWRRKKRCGWPKKRARSTFRRAEMQMATRQPFMFVYLSKSGGRYAAKHKCPRSANL